MRKKTIAVLVSVLLILSTYSPLTPIIPVKAQAQYSFPESYGGIIIDHATGSITKLGFREDFSRNVLTFDNWTQIYGSNYNDGDYINLEWNSAEGRIEVSAWHAASGGITKILGLRLPENITYPFNTRINVTAFLYETISQDGSYHGGCLLYVLNSSSLTNFTLPSRLAHIGCSEYSNSLAGQISSNIIGKEVTGSWTAEYAGLFRASIVFTSNSITTYLDNDVIQSLNVDMSRYNITYIAWWIWTDYSTEPPPGSYIDDLIVKAGFIIVRNLKEGSFVKLYINGQFMGEKQALKNDTVYFLFDQELLPADIDVKVIEQVATLPSNSIFYTHYVTYSPNSTQFTHSLSATNTTTANYVTATPEAWGWVLKCQPYINASVEYADSNRTVVGTWVAGSLSDLQSEDYTVMRFDTANQTNTMVAVLDYNITIPAWLPIDKIIDFTIKIAGNVSEVTPNTASLEIYDFSLDSFHIVDSVALNSTTHVLKTYTITSPADYVSAGKIWLRINYTKAESYPSSVNTIDIDFIEVRIRYQNETEATLVSEVLIVIPYGKAVVENITLSIRANGTGSSRKVGIEVLNSTLGLVASTSNATFTTTWGTYTLAVNSEITDNMTLRLTLYAKSTTTANEEVDVMDVKVYVKMNTSLTVTTELSVNVKHFNSTSKKLVELGSSEYLNNTYIILKIVEFLKLNATDYPVTPVEIGTETVGAYNYTVYKIEPANYTQTLALYTLLRNVLDDFTIHIRNVNVTKAVIGERIYIDLPQAGNITVKTGAYRLEFIGVTQANWRANVTGSYTITVNVTDVGNWCLGLAYKTIDVVYGVFKVVPVDNAFKVIDYENLRFYLVNRVDGSIVKELTGNTVFSLDNLWAENYTLIIEYMGVKVAQQDFVLNITTYNTTVNMTTTMQKIPLDYRKINKTMAWLLDTKLVDVKDLNPKLPYSRTEIWLNGSGSFTLILDYKGDLPTKIGVTAINITDLKYYWNGNALFIEGVLNGTGILNVTDYYRFRVYVYDRLGNLMGSWFFVYVNRTRYGSVIDVYYYPEDYVISLPDSIKGFKFYQFWDGYNQTVRPILLNHTDIEIKIYYRVPTAVSKIGGVRLGVTPLSLLKQWLMGQAEGELVKVFFEGYLLDYYGSGVPNRTLTIKITNLKTGYTRTINVTTDLSGYWRTPVLELPRGQAYKVTVTFSGDDTYVESSVSKTIMIESLPIAPTWWEQYYMFIILVVVTIATIVIAFLISTRLLKKTMPTRPRKYLRIGK